jgi:hypothetical protein
MPTFEGSWTYRSYLNNSDQTSNRTGLLFGLGKLVLTQWCRSDGRNRRYDCPDRAAFKRPSARRRDPTLLASAVLLRHPNTSFS